MQCYFFGGAGKDGGHVSRYNRSKEVEKIKKDFVVNVSHELRTPLTSIKGFVETLEEEIDEKNREYVKIIKRNTDRLTNIVEDLLLLSELEEKGTALHLESLRPQKHA